MSFRLLAFKTFPELYLVLLAEAAEAMVSVEHVSAEIIDVTDDLNHQSSEVCVPLINGKLDKRSMEEYFGKVVKTVNGALAFPDHKGLIDGFELPLVIEVHMPAGKPF